MDACAIMEQEYEVVEKENTTFTILGLKYTGITQRFVYLDLIVVSQLLQIRAPTDQNYLVQLQGEDRDVEKMQPVFEAVLTSMCQSFNAGT